VDQPGTFTPEQVTPHPGGGFASLLDSRIDPLITELWRAFTDEVIKRKSFPRISVSPVGRLLRDADLHPHRSKYAEQRKGKDPEFFLRSSVHTVFFRVPNK